MTEDLVLPVTYQNIAYELPVQLMKYGWTYRIAVTMGETELIFEPDEEGQLRTIGEFNEEIGLVRAIAAQLEKLR